MKKSPLILLCVLLLSCAKKTVDIDLAAINLPQFLERVRARDGRVWSVRGLAYVGIRARDQSISFQQVTIVQEPDLLRLEALTPLGGTAVMIISDGKKVEIISRRDRQVFDSPEEFDLSLFYPDLPVKIKVARLIDLLLHGLLEAYPYDDSTARLSREGSHVLLSFLNEKNMVDTFWVNPQNHAIEKARIFLEGNIPATCRFGNFRNFGAGVLFPTTVKLELDEFSISIRYHDEIEVNADIDRKLFQLSPSFAGFEKKI